MLIATVATATDVWLHGLTGDTRNALACHSVGESSQRCQTLPEWLNSRSWCTVPHFDVSLVVRKEPTVRHPHGLPAARSCMHWLHHDEDGVSCTVLPNNASVQDTTPDTLLGVFYTFWRNTILLPQKTLDNSMKLGPFSRYFIFLYYSQTFQCFVAMSKRSWLGDNHFKTSHSAVFYRVGVRSQRQHTMRLVKLGGYQYIINYKSMLFNIKDWRTRFAKQQPC